MPINPSSPLLSLFCGAGGLDIGFEKQGFEVGLAFDIRQDSVNSYNQNRKNKCGHVQDINKLTVEKLDELYGAEFNPIGLIGGPPCQGFSISNVNKQKSDKRNRLSFTYVNLLSQLNNRNPVHFFVFENVTGLLGDRHKNTFKTIKKSFEGAGFNIFVSTLNAMDFGTPQNRERLIIVGLNKAIYSKTEWQPPQTVNGYSVSPVTVRNAIGDLPDPIYFSDVKSKDDIKHHPNHWCMTPKSPKFHTKETLSEGESYGRSFRTLTWDKPSPTVAYGNREVHVHPSGKRRLSVYEAMLLQGFPKKYELAGNLSQQITQVSEAVPPPLSEVIARSIIKQT